MANKRVFRQVLLIIVIPLLIALVALTALNYQNTKALMMQANAEKNTIISDEVINALEFQDIMLDMIESGMYSKMQEYSNKLVNDIFADTKDIETTDLNAVRKVLGFNPDLEDIYVINKDGIVVNTTFKADMGLNFFEFGEKHKQLLQGIFKKQEFVSERFGVEAKSKRIKKYSYQTTQDGKYIIELGFYSEEADETIDFMKNRLNILSEKNDNIESVELFIGADEPFSLNKDAGLKEGHVELMKKAIETKSTQSTIEKEGEKVLHYSYVYMNRKNTDLYSDSVIRIVSDRTNISKIKNELMISVIVFVSIFILVVILFYNRSKKTV